MVGVSVSGFYLWRARKPSPRTVRHAMLAEVIREVHDRSRQTYGARRVHAELVFGRQMTVARCTVELVMRRLGLAGLPGRPKYRKIPNTPTAEDLVNRDFARTEPNRLWLTDITEHRTREGKVYCAVVLDAFSRRVVGWSIDSSQTSSLVVNALGMAIENRQAEGPVMHSDHGTQYPSWAFTRRALDSGLVPSMRSIGDCYDNGLMESFWARMQVELLNRKRWNTRLELANAMFEYLEIFHNRQRRHSSLGMPARSSTNSATPTASPAIKRADRATPGAHESLHQTRGASLPQNAGTVGLICAGTSARSSSASRHQFGRE